MVDISLTAPTVKIVLLSEPFWPLEQLVLTANNYVLKNIVLFNFGRLFKLGLLRIMLLLVSVTRMHSIVVLSTCLSCLPAFLRRIVHPPALPARRSSFVLCTPLTCGPQPRPRVRPLMTILYLSAHTAVTDTLMLCLLPGGGKIIYDAFGTWRYGCAQSGGFRENEVPRLPPLSRKYQGRVQIFSLSAWRASERKILAVRVGVHQARSVCQGKGCWRRRRTEIKVVDNIGKRQRIWLSYLQWYFHTMNEFWF